MEIRKRKGTHVGRLTVTDKQHQEDLQRLRLLRPIDEDKGADPRRASYHSSVMDIENLHSGQEFKELPDTYTIFIIEKDFYGQGEAVYPIERINLATGKTFEDGEHILYVIGEYRGDAAI